MKEYYWHGMKDGKLLDGSFAVSIKTASPELLKQLAKPGGHDPDSWAIVEKYGEEPWQRVIVEIVSRA